jgi:hypothetical protein
MDGLAAPQHLLVLRPQEMPALAVYLHSPKYICNFLQKNSSNYFFLQRRISLRSLKTTQQGLNILSLTLHRETNSGGLTVAFATSPDCIGMLPRLLSAPKLKIQVESLDLSPQTFANS